MSLIESKSIDFSEEKGDGASQAEEEKLDAASDVSSRQYSEDCSSMVLGCVGSTKAKPDSKPDIVNATNDGNSAVEAKPDSEPDIVNATNDGNSAVEANPDSERDIVNATNDVNSAVEAKLDSEPDIVNATNNGNSAVEAKPVGEPHIVNATNDGNSAVEANPDSEPDIVNATNDGNSAVKAKPDSELDIANATNDGNSAVEVKPHCQPDIVNATNDGNGALKAIPDSEPNIVNATNDGKSVVEAKPDNEPEIVTAVRDGNGAPEDKTACPVGSLTSASCIQETQTMSSSTLMTPFVRPIPGPVVHVYSPYIEDQRVVATGPNVFEKNIRNAIESRRQDESVIDIDDQGSQNSAAEKGVSMTTRSSNNDSELADSTSNQHVKTVANMDTVRMNQAMQSVETQTTEDAKDFLIEDQDSKQTGPLVDMHSDNNVESAVGKQEMGHAVEDVEEDSNPAGVTDTTTTHLLAQPGDTETIHSVSQTQPVANKNASEDLEMEPDTAQVIPTDSLNALAVSQTARAKGTPDLQTQSSEAQPKTDSQTESAEATPDSETQSAGAQPKTDSQTESAEATPDSETQSAEPQPKTDSQTESAEATPDSEAQSAGAQPKTDSQTESAEATPDSETQSAGAQPKTDSQMESAEATPDSETQSAGAQPKTDSETESAEATPDSETQSAEPQPKTDSQTESAEATPDSETQSAGAQPKTDSQTESAEATPDSETQSAEPQTKTDSQTESAEATPDSETQSAVAATLAEAKEWHDSIVRRVERLRGLSCWLGERNKRMDGMVEILVRSLEHMGVGAVTDHVGNLIPLQNFRLNSAIKLSSTDNTWVTCDQENMSNDINSWLPDTLPDDQNLSLTTEQMRKYERQVEALRAENESLQRSLQSALDNQGSLGVQINQWQACIDSAGQQLSRVTQEVHESKSRERHLRHLLGEERRVKDSLVQQNSLTKAEYSAESANEQALSATSETSATFMQNVTLDRQQVTSNATPQEVGNESSPVVEKTWQPRRGFSHGSSDARSSTLNSLAPPFVSAYSSTARRPHYHGNYHITPESPHSRYGSRRNFGLGHGRHGSSGRGYYRKEHSTHAGFNRLLDGFFDNLNRIENALRQQGINVPGPMVEASPLVPQHEPLPQISHNASIQHPTIHDMQQTAPNQPIYYTTPAQPSVVYVEPSDNTVVQPVQSIPSTQQVSQIPVVVPAVEPHVQFAPVEGQVY